MLREVPPKLCCRLHDLLNNLLGRRGRRRSEQFLHPLEAKKRFVRRKRLRDPVRHDNNPLAFGDRLACGVERTVDSAERRSVGLAKNGNPAFRQHLERWDVTCIRVFQHAALRVKQADEERDKHPFRQIPDEVAIQMLNDFRQV